MRLSLRPGPFGYARLARVALLVGLMLAALDAGLAARERRLLADLFAGRLRNAAGPAIADATRWALLESPEDRRRQAIALVGSSVTFGPNLGADETIPAQLAGRLRESGQEVPVLNLSQKGGSPRTPPPVAAALGTRPIRALLVELMVSSYAEREKPPSPELPTDELALLEAASPAQRARLAEAGLRARAALRIEVQLTSLARRSWRLYRLRGDLWWDPEFTPSYVVWSVRREIATAGLLPRRFHGQTTNVGKLPWRRAYTGGQRPGPAQSLLVPTERIGEKDYASLLLTRDLAQAAGVPVWFYEIPLNLPFQREFGLMDEADLVRLAALRAALLARMAADGLRVIEAPAVPEDGFLDKAHLTPLGCSAVAERLADALRSLAARPS